MNARADTPSSELDIAPVATRDAASFVPLDQERLQAILDRRSVGSGFPGIWDARVVQTTASTNSDLLREARSGNAFPRPTVLAAEHQTAGRGRLGRAWQSRPGASLTASYALRIALRLGEIEGISLVCGLAVRDALAAYGVRAGLKWPNDVLVDGRKLAGILVEAQALPTSTIAIIGIGINVLPQGADDAHRDARGLAAIDLKSAGGSLMDRNALAADLALALDKRIARFVEKGFADVASEWNAADAFRDRLVALGAAPEDSVAGIARGVDTRGALLIEIDGACKRFIAGDLSLRAIDTHSTAR